MRVLRGARGSARIEKSECPLWLSLNQNVPFGLSLWAFADTLSLIDVLMLITRRELPRRTLLHRTPIFLFVIIRGLRGFDWTRKSNATYDCESMQHPAKKCACNPHCHDIQKSNGLKPFKYSPNDSNRHACRSGKQAPQSKISMMFPHVQIPRAYLETYLTLNSVTRG